MKLTLKRTDLTGTYTGGILEVRADDDTLLMRCHTLEDPVREIEPGGKGKIHGKTAILVGVYRVVLSFSNRFQVVMPELLEVLYFAGIRIHVGNTVVDTDGCILVGENRSGSFLGNSKKAYKRLMVHLNAAHKKKEKVFITVT
ncbi:DUF5675 family protein [Tellurirhabdus bombi]|uniref:DUF5675 family protein n=1 Tax=Tellurirhabdus bombi TaxID=2907205 RepID=UPI001F397B11|nr:DUF5675 family protein [Tellurirhabdus bombi]